MEERVQKQVFARGSTNYFNSSAFFPKAVLRDVESLYGFVRLADDFVDAVPQDADGFRRFVAGWRALAAVSETGSKDDSLGTVGMQAIDTNSATAKYDTASANSSANWSAGLSALESTVIGDFVELCRRRNFDPAWTEAFLAAMEADLSKKIYASEAETLSYVYGSAEVIGLYMARILDLPPESDHAACMLGRAMQYINFIRDVAEDSSFGRRYLPLNGAPWPADWLPNQTDAKANPQAWAAFLHGHLERYRQWQSEAEAGYSKIPKRPRAAIRTAGDMYNWTGRVIAADPLVVFERKVKPSKRYIVFKALWNLLAG